MNENDSKKINKVINNIEITKLTGDTYKLNKEDATILYDYIINLENDYDRVCNMVKIKRVEQRMLKATYSGKD